MHLPRPRQLVRNPHQPAGIHVIYDSKPERAYEERLYRALVEKFAAGITLLDANFTPFYRRPANATIFGYDHDTTFPFQAVPHQPESRDIRDQLWSLAPSESFTYEFRTTRPDSDSRWRNGIFTNRLHDTVLRAHVFNFNDIVGNKRIKDATELNSHVLLESNRELELRIR